MNRLAACVYFPASLFERYYDRVLHYSATLKLSGVKPNRRAARTHFLTNSGQFTRTSSAGAGVSATNVLTRKRLPSAVTS